MKLFLFATVLMVAQAKILGFDFLDSENPIQKWIEDILRSWFHKDLPDLNDPYQKTKHVPNMLDLIFEVFPQLLPNHEVNENDPHHRDKNHLTDHDFRLDFEEIVRADDYKVENRTVQTDDGYLLTVFRIRHPNTPERAPVVFLQHGILDTADCWIMHHSDESPAFVLAEEGYDVWLGNSRGSRYGRAHTTLDPDSKNEDVRKRFFDFTWQEMAEFDLPAQVAFVLNATGASNLTFMAHSSGTTQMFYALTNPKMQQYLHSTVNLFVALAPTTKINHSPSTLLHQYISNKKIIDWFLRLFKLYEVFGIYWNEIFRFVCGIDDAICTKEEGQLINLNPSLDDEDRFQVYMGHLPGGSSVKVIDHFVQNIQADSFQLYDYGSGNMERYGRSQPLKVNLSKVKEAKVPIALWAGTQDELSDIEDVDWAISEIEGEDKEDSPFVVKEKIEAGQATFLVGEDMSYLEDLVVTIKEHNPVPEWISKEEPDVDLEGVVNKYNPGN